LENTLEFTLEITGVVDELPPPPPPPQADIRNKREMDTTAGREGNNPVCRKNFHPLLPG
jgi:hypothetical protein